MFHTVRLTVSSSSVYLAPQRFACTHTSCRSPSKHAPAVIALFKTWGQTAFLTNTSCLDVADLLESWQHTTSENLAAKVCLAVSWVENASEQIVLQPAQHGCHLNIYYNPVWLQMVKQTLNFGICSAKTAKHTRNPAATNNTNAKLRPASFHRPLRFVFGNKDWLILTLLVLFRGRSISPRCGSAVLYTFHYICII